MGDDYWVDVDVPLQNSDERTKLLSPDRNWRQSHHRSVSYGSFLPTFTVDSVKLRSLLPEEKSENEAGNLENSVNRGRSHCRIDSLIDKSSFIRSESVTFLSTLEGQLESLFTFLSLHLSQVQEEMEKFETRSHQASAALEVMSNDAVSVDSKTPINGNEEDMLDNTSVDGDSGIEDDHLSSTKGFLSRMREVLRGMKSSLDTSMQQLDELVGIYDQRTQEDAAKLILNSHQSKNVELKNEIDGYLSRIDTKLKKFNDDDGTSKKILEVKTIQRAKKEKMKCLDFFGFLLLLVSSSAVIYLSLTMPSSKWTIFMRLLRSPLMVVGYMYLLGFNMMVWARSGINYISIFDFPRESSPTPKFMFRMANMFSFLFALMIGVGVAVGIEYLYISDKITAFMMWIAIGLFWLNPFNILNRLGRLSFMLVFVKVLIAPLPTVLFADFWLADQLNSLLAFILDIQYLTCYSVSSSSWNEDSVGLKSCTTVSNGIRPILSCLPALWRLLQCLRCYQKTRKVAHLFNAAKYFTTFPVVVFATFFAVNVKPFSSLSDIDLSKTGWMIIAWLVSSLIHALYTFYWDITMDWGLLRVCDGYVLRPTLLYRRWIYPVAICIDFVIRFACVAKLTLAIVYHIDSDVIYTMLILSEVLRRVLWNFFRIEYEQVLRSN